MKFKTFVFKRTKEKSTRNVVIGLLYQVFSILMGLVLPYLFIIELGSEVNGLMSSVGQVFTCLGLLEAGIGTATIQALYKPIAQNDKDSINGILSATNYYYRRIAYIYIGTIVILACIFPFFVDTKIDNTTIRLVILLQGAGSVISYLVQSKYTLLLQAEGKNYVLSWMMLIGLIVRNFGKIFAISIGYGIIAVQTVQLATVCGEALFILLYVKRKYKWLTLSCKPNYKAISAKNSVFLQSVAWMVFNHTDIIVLTVFSRDLALVSVYSVYSLLFEAGQNIMNVIRESYRYKLGAVYQEGTIAFDEYFSKFSTVFITLSFAVFSTIFLVSKTFVELYTTSVTDVNYSIMGVAELFFMYKLLYTIRIMNKQVVEVNGDFKAVSHVAITETIMNIILSVILVKKLGIIGVLIGTLVALVYTFFAYRKYLKNNCVPKSMKSQLSDLLIYALPMVSSLIIDIFIPVHATNWFQFVLFGVVVGIIELIIYGGIQLLKIGLKTGKWHKL